MIVNLKQVGLFKGPETSKKVENLFRNFIFMIACYFLFFIGLNFLSIYFPQLDLQKYQQLELLKTLEDQPLKFIFMAAIAAPIIEESLFRSILRPSVKSLRIFFCAILYMLGMFLMPEEGHWLLKLVIIISCLALFYYAIQELIPDNLMERLCKWLDRFYIQIWLIGAVLFGFVHIYNYVDSFVLDTVLLVTIFPRIIAGYFFGKVKIQNKGLLWPILLHSMNNSMVLVFLIPYSLFNA